MKIFESIIGAPLIARTYAKYSEFFRDFYAEAATEVVSRLEKGTVLDIGTGPAHLPIEIAKRSKLSVIGIDVSKRMVSMAKQNVKRERLEDKIRIEEGDVHRLEFQDDHFDLVVSTASLHHWHAPIKAFNEIYRVLKPGGIVLVADLRRDAPMEKVRELTKQMPFFCRFGIRHSIKSGYTTRECLEMLHSTKFNEFSLKEKGIFLLIEARKIRSTKLFNTRKITKNQGDFHGSK